MGWLVLGLRPAVENAACGVTQKRGVGARPEVGMSFTHANCTDPTETEVRARMKVLIGVDPHKASVAVAVVDEVGEFVECATFPQNRTGLRSLQRSKRNASPSVLEGGGERWRPRGRHLAGRLAAAGEESVVDVSSPSFHSTGAGAPL